MKNDDNSKELKHKCDDSKFPADVSDKKNYSAIISGIWTYMLINLRIFFSEEK